MFERILVPLDGSSLAETILPQLGRLLRREDSEVILLRAVPPGEDDAGTPPESERKAAEDYLHEIALSLARRGVKVHSCVAPGYAAAAILEQAENQGATLIAMSTHGRTGLSRFFAGSTAEKVVRASRLPVLLVRSFQAAGQGFEAAPGNEALFRKILVPTDGSKTAMAVVGPAEKFAQLCGSEVVVLHVRVPPNGLALPGMEAAVLGGPLPPPDPDEVTDAMAQRFEHAGLQVRRIVAAGDPAAEILDHSLASGVDLIALATHGRSGLSRWMLGSVTERVLRHATVPILVVRPSPPLRAEARSASGLNSEK